MNITSNLPRFQCNENDLPNYYNQTSKSKYSQKANFNYQSSCGIHDNFIDLLNDNESRNKDSQSKCITEIYKNLKKKESICVNDYMKWQIDINHRMREILIDWLFEIQSNLFQNYDIIFLAVNLIDRYLNINKIQRDKLQLLGITAYMIASKYYSFKGLEPKFCSYCTENFYKPEEIIDLENNLLILVSYQLEISTINKFIPIFTSYLDMNKQESNLALMLACISLECYEIIKFKPSLIALYCCQLAKSFISKTPLDLLLSEYPENELKESIAMLKKSFQEMKDNSHSTLIIIFSRNEFNNVAKNEVYINS